MTTDAIIEKIENSRKELLELSLRNPLLNYRLLRAKGVEAVGADPTAVFKTLVSNNGTMRFLAAESTSKASNRLHTVEASEQLERRLLRTYYDANTLIQEQGVNTLFIALGMVRWYESDSSDVERKAPIVLIPVRIERANVNAVFTVKYSGEELGANIVLTQKVKNDFFIDLPELPEDEEDIDIAAYFADVARSIRRMKRWSVDRYSVVLGFFSFSKLLMYRDLDPNNWPEGAGPANNNNIRALFAEGFRELGSIIGEDEQLDKHLKPNEVFHVVDADSSQAKAIYDVSNGRNLIIQGPPGTGKSQTITNIIAEGIAQGKKILFVAEKMAALEVVKRRLDSIEIGDACLELHSHKTQKRAVLDELKRTLELGEPNTEGIEDDFVALTQHRDTLNEYAQAINTPVGDTGITPFRSYGELERIKSQYGDNSLYNVRVEGIDSWPNVDFQRKAGIVSELQTILGGVGVPQEHIFRGSCLRVVTPITEVDLRDAIYESIDSLNTMTKSALLIGNSLGLDVPEDIAQLSVIFPLAEHAEQAPNMKGVSLKSLEPVSRRREMRELLSLHERLVGLHAEYNSQLKSAAWNADVSEFPRIFSTTGFLGRIFSSEYKAAKQQLTTLCYSDPPKDAEQQIVLANAILNEQQTRRDIEKLATAADAVLGKWWRGEEDSDWTAIERILEWVFALFEDIDTGKVLPILAFAMSDEIDAIAVKDALAQTQAALESYRARIAELENTLDLDNTRQFDNADGLAALPFTKQQDVLTEWSNGINKIRDIANFNEAASKVIVESLGAIVELARNRQDASTLLAVSFENTRHSAILSRAIRERPSLANFNASVHQQVIERFRSMDELSLAHNRSRVAHVHWSGTPKHAGGGQLGILTREFAKRRRHLAIRQLIGLAGNAIQAIKPVFMMSPLSVATYLKPGSVKFDLVVFDEASQVKPVEALGALIRADQAVVVGDDKQLPPTNFFNTAIESDDDEVATANMESILGLFSAQGAPSRMLRWHYRSRHESLIAVSNSEFYDNRLVVFPSPDKENRELGLQYRRLDTKYEGSGINREEAQQVAKAVMEHARLYPDLSLGVATFSVSQRDAVLDSLELLRHQDDSCESFFNDHPEEPFFVKNLENVQGDERDVIFISVGYGRSADGRVRQNFGPLNNDGGERRLNVLITRAKQRCHVSTNLQSDDVRLTASSRDGVKAFKKFLAYAEHGEISEISMPSGREAASPFQQEVANKLRSYGYEIHDEIASSGFFVDIGVVDPNRPGRYVLGIECDGATYHSSQSARDRDRLREQVLVGLGWRLHRIWSTDWFHNSERELRRAVEAIESAIAEQSDNEPPSTKPLASNNPSVQRADAEQESHKTDIPPYEQASPVVYTGGFYELGNAPTSYLLEPIIEVVKIESPVHKDEVIRRITNAAGLKRAGSRIRRNLDWAIDNVVRRNEISRKGNFLWAQDMQLPFVRDRSELPSQQKKIEYISSEEIVEAFRLVVESSYGIDCEEAIKEVANLLGFRRITKDVGSILSSAMDSMIRGGLLKLDSDHLTLP